MWSLLSTAASNRFGAHSISCMMTRIVIFVIMCIRVQAGGQVFDDVMQSCKGISIFPTRLSRVVQRVALIAI